MGEQFDIFLDGSADGVLVTVSAAVFVLQWHGSSPDALRALVAFLSDASDTGPIVAGSIFGVSLEFQRYEERVLIKARGPADPPADLLKLMLADQEVPILAEALSNSLDDYL